MAEELIAGRYRLLEPLGRGAMSSVWRAHDDELAREVAVKMLAPSAERERFEREARAAASLSHPNIVQVYDYGETRDQRPFMVLELLPGGSLEDRLRDGRPLPDDETTEIVGEVAAGLAHAHERGLVHRDLKPANILFDAGGRAKIADFGIARMVGTGTFTDAGTVLGTASYISPEQASGGTAGPPSDVYSFGVILFRLLTGVLPFVSANAMELVRMHRDAQPPPVRSVRPDAPAALASLADASLAKSPGDRPADGTALLALLRDDGSTAATQVFAALRRRRSPLFPAAIAAVLLLGGGAAAAILLTDGNGSSGTTSVQELTLPAVSSEGSTPTTLPTTTTPTTTSATTTAPAPTTSTAPTTTTKPPPTTTTLPPTTTVVPPTTTVVPPTTTEPATTVTTTPATTAEGTTTTSP